MLLRPADGRRAPLEAAERDGDGAAIPLLPPPPADRPAPPLFSRLASWWSPAAPPDGARGSMDLREFGRRTREAFPELTLPPPILGGRGPRVCLLDMASIFDFCNGFAGAELAGLG